MPPLFEGCSSNRWKHGVCIVLRCDVRLFRHFALSERELSMPRVSGISTSSLSSQHRRSRSQGGIRPKNGLWGQKSQYTPLHTHVLSDVRHARPVRLVPLLQLADQVGQPQLLRDGDLLNLRRGGATQRRSRCLVNIFWGGRGSVLASEAAPLD